MNSAIEPGTHIYNYSLYEAVYLSRQYFTIILLKNWKPNKKYTSKYLKVQKHNRFMCRLHHNLYLTVSIIDCFVVWWIKKRKYQPE